MMSSRCTWLYVLKLKYDASNVLQWYCLMIETQFETKIQIIRLDNREEFDVK